MILGKTRLSVADNSGALVAECIKILNKKTVGTVGDIIIVAIKNAQTRKKVRKHDVQRGVIVKIKKNLPRNNSGTSIRFTRNVLVIVDKKNNPLGNRIKGSVCRELRKKKFMKLVSMASSIL